MIYKIEASHLTIKRAKDIYREGLLHFALAKEVTIDLSEVTKIDTSGVAVIVGWWRHAQKQGVECKLVLSKVITEIFSSYHLSLPEMFKEA